MPSRHSGAQVILPTRLSFLRKYFFLLIFFSFVGRGKVNDDMETSHYMKNFEPSFVPIRTQRAKQVPNSFREASLFHTFHTFDSHCCSPAVGHNQ
jgi:hypothetical protein